MARPRSFDRDAALERAMLAFWERGYERTSISDLTETMGIAAPSLYAAFGDKRALFDEAVERYQSRPGAFVRRALEEDTARGAIERLLREAALEYSTAGRPRGCLVITEPLLAEHRQASRDEIAERLRRGVDELPPGTDVDALASFFSAVIAGLSSRARDGATREQLTAAAEIALRAWPR
jgi:TetR/AcrR family transcriptional regulator, copper-responsive repressor